MRESPQNIGNLVGAVGIELKARLKPRKILILRSAKTAQTPGFAKARYTPGTIIRYLSFEFGKRRDQGCTGVPPAFDRWFETYGSLGYHQ